MNDVDAKNDQNFGEIMKFIEKLDKKVEAIHEYLVQIDSVQVKLLEKVHKIESENHDNFRGFEYSPEKGQLFVSNYNICLTTS